MATRMLSFFGLLTLGLTSFGYGQAVQLPTIHVTGVSTTVMVPDRGSMLLGGVSRSSSGSVSRGVPGLSHVPGANRLFGNRAIGSSTGAGMMSVSAHIHDLREMDEALLAEAAALRGDGGGVRITANDVKADFISRHIETRAAERTRLVANPKVADPKVTVPSIDEIREQNALAVDKQNTEARTFLDQGQQAENAGKPGVAKIFYNMAARRATGELQAEVRTRLATLATEVNKTGSYALGR